MIGKDFCNMEDRLEFDDVILAYNKLLRENIDLLHRINNQDVTIISLKEKVKSLSRQINFLNRAIWRYKHEKNS